MLKPAAIDLGEIVEKEIENQGEDKKVTEEVKTVLTKKSEKKIANTQKAVIKRLLCASVICVIFMVVEVVGGIIADSIAVLSDAAHMLSDVIGLIISVIFAWVSTRPASGKYSFGFHRAGVIGALASIIILWIFTVVLVIEAVHRISEPEEVDGKIMFITALFGLIVNILMIKILHGHGHGHEHGHSHGHSHSHDHKHEKKEGKNNHKEKMIENGTVKSDNHVIELPQIDLEKKESQDGLSPTENPGHHDHDHDHNHSHGHEHGHSHSHDHKHDHSHSHDHKHEKKANKKKSHKHDHGHSHEHSHGNSTKNNESLRAALIHVLGDTLQSVGVVIAAILIWIWPDKLKIADPICTFIFSAIVLVSSLTVVKDCLRVLMEGTPKNMDLNKLLSEFEGLPGVKEVHDFHVWCISADKVSMSVHIRTTEVPKKTLKSATDLCRKYGIQHSTIQVEEDEDAAFIDCSHDMH